jgi:hypothetical protein
MTTGVEIRSPKAETRIPSALAHVCQEKAIALDILRAAEAAISALDKSINPNCEDRFKTGVSEGLRIAARSDFERIASLARTAARHLKKNLSCNTPQGESVDGNSLGCLSSAKQSSAPRKLTLEQRPSNPGRALEVAG